MSGIRFAAIALLACGSVGCGQASPAASASAPAANDIAVRKASETGSTECDDYVRLVSHCIDTKMAESDRNDARRDLAIFRKAMANLSPTMQSAQAASCTDMIWRKIQFDSDGCYTEEAAGRGIVTPCTLLSHAELEAIVGAHLEQGVHDSTTCTYPFAGVVHIPLKITVHWKDGRDDMDAARGGEKLLAGKVGKNPVFDGLLSGETVPGLGDDAYVTMAGGWPLLTTRLNDVAVGVEGVMRDQAIAIARKALPKVTPEPNPEREGSSR